MRARTTDSDRLCSSGVTCVDLSSASSSSEAGPSRYASPASLHNFSFVSAERRKSINPTNARYRDSSFFGRARIVHDGLVSRVEATEIAVAFFLPRYAQRRPPPTRHRHQVTNQHVEVRASTASAAIAARDPREGRPGTSIGLTNIFHSSHHVTIWRLHPGLTPDHGVRSRSSGGSVGVGCSGSMRAQAILSAVRM